MEDLWLTWAKRLQGIASTGIHFSRDQYDKERYGEVASIAHQMLASLASVPVSRIQGLVSEFARGCDTQGRCGSICAGSFRLVHRQL
jgi:hypothetical protein